MCNLTKNVLRITNCQPKIKHFKKVWKTHKFNKKTQNILQVYIKIQKLKVYEWKKYVSILLEKLLVYYTNINNDVQYSLNTK